MLRFIDCCIQSIVETVIMVLQAFKFMNSIDTQALDRMCQAALRYPNRSNNSPEFVQKCETLVKEEIMVVTVV